MTFIRMMLMEETDEDLARVKASVQLQENFLDRRMTTLAVSVAIGSLAAEPP